MGGDETLCYPIGAAGKMRISGLNPISTFDRQGISGSKRSGVRNNTRVIKNGNSAKTIIAPNTSIACRGSPAGRNMKNQSRKYET